jgi:hypothetical protein
MYAFKVVSYFGEGREYLNTFTRSVDGDGGGTVKKESKKEVETVANNYPR